MREHSRPLTVEIPDQGNLTDDVVSHAQTHADVALLRRKTDDGWNDVSAAQFCEQVRAVAKGLIAAGVREGDRVALISKTRYEWTLIDYAIWFAGAVTVPIYETSSSKQIEWILSDSQASAVICETKQHSADMSGITGELYDLDQIWCLDEGGIDLLINLGAEVTEDELEGRRTSCNPSSLATIVYTSGTTDRPKGCMLTHGNFMFELGAAIDDLAELFDEEGASTLLFLPLAHVFARIIQVGAIRARVCLGHTADAKTLLDDLQEFQPTFFLAVPRVFENVFNTASQKAAADGRGSVFVKGADAAIAYSRALDRGRPPLHLRARHTFYDRLVYRKLRDAFGGQCRFAISGGAPLGERLAHFYQAVGLRVLEGYGLTETTAAVTVNRPGAVEIGTVGQPLGGTELRIADDGELLVRGGQVFAGYWRNDQASEEVVTRDGWLRTGDLAEIDDQGYVRITGRKKEIIVTAGGKNVAPSVLEDRVRAHPLVSQCMVVGDGQPFIAALVTLDPDSIQQWARERGRPVDVAMLAEDPDMRAEVQLAVDDANQAVSQAESIRKFAILPLDWTEERGELTPSLKLKRNMVLKNFRAEIDHLFG